MSAHPRLAVSTLSMWNWPLPRDLALLQSLGVKSIGVFFALIKDDPAGAGLMIAEAGLSCSNVTADCGGVSIIAQTEAGSASALEALRPSIDFAASCGGVPCYFATGPTPLRMPTDEAFELLIPAVAPLARYATDVGVPLALEHNNASTRDAGFVNTLHDCVEFAHRTGVGICLELQNCWIERDLPRLFRDNVGRFAVVQVSDYLVGESSRLNRRSLGDGSIPLEWLLGLLLEAGYTGMFEIEVLGPAIEEEGYASAVARSVEWLDNRLVSWGV